uniref:General transcription factor 3C polypeptide 2 n=1 Tax=Anthurium amnicola TaxID=1678845 RepID=A0A1D1XR54_9ARAE
MEGSVEREERECQRSCEEAGRAAASTTEDVGTVESGVVVSLFNDSAEQFVSTMEAVSSLCGFQDEDETFDQSEIQRLSSTITFLKEWRYFCYESKIVNFTNETKFTPEKEGIKGINLPQFSSATVPERGQSCGTRSLNSKDFVLHAGGSVWALDWCPRMRQMLDRPIKCEYLAVAAHPPDSSYHKIGSPLTGRGIVQIWCVLNMNGIYGRCSQKPKEMCRKESSNIGRPRGRPRKRPLRAEPLGDANDELKSDPPRRRGRPRKRPVAIEPLDDPNVIDNIIPPKRPRGRPRKMPDKKGTIDGMDLGDKLSMAKFIPSLAVDDTHVKDKSSVRRPRGRPRKTSDETEKGDHVHADEGLSNSKIISHTVFYDSNAKSTFPPCKRKGRPRKKPDRMENADVNVVGDLSTMESIHTHVAEDLNVKTESSPLRRPRGRPIKRPDKIANVHDPHLIHDLNVTEFAPQFIDDSNVEIKSSLPKRGRGRPKKGSNKMSSHLNGQQPKCQVQKGSARDVNDILVSDTVKQVELRRDVYDLTRTDGLVNTSNDVPRECPLDSTANSPNFCIPRKDAHDVARKDSLNISNDVLHECHMDERTSTANITNLCTQRSLKAGLGVANDGNSVRPIFFMRDMEADGRHVEDALDSSHEMVQKTFLDDNNVNLNLHKDVALPRVVLCLGHNGKVAWDVKWKPFHIDDNCKHRMGYLAVMLGNGSLEVWEVPHPGIVKNLFKSSSKEGTDPRFLKLHPVFRCSKLKFADKQCIPLTMEWSRSAQSDLILVGCHDGTVALWKFSAEDSSQDTRPLLCFTADIFPIRAVAWAPGESDSESSNLIVTAGHESLKFWDIRDPYRPLWNVNPAPKSILSLDWLQHPSCLIFSLDDGTIKTLSLCKSAYDVPVTGKPFNGAKHGVQHTYYRSPFAIWSVQVSPITGVAAYCCADGNVLCFQVTAKSVDKDNARYRSPHFLCGAVFGNSNILTIYTPMPYTAVAQLPRPVRGLPSHANCTLGRDPQVQGEDPAVNLGHGVSEPSAGRKLTSKTSNYEKPLDENRGVKLVNTDGVEGQKNLNINVMNTSSSNQDFLVFPPKIVAMHRVRWNINRGSERWLCYGGAAGIIRCQEIALPSDF